MRATGGPRPSTCSSKPKVGLASSHSLVHVGVRFRTASCRGVCCQALKRNLWLIGPKPQNLKRYLWLIDL